MKTLELVTPYWTCLDIVYTGTRPGSLTPKQVPRISLFHFSKPRQINKLLKAVKVLKMAIYRFKFKLIPIYEIFSDTESLSWVVLKKPRHLSPIRE